MESSSLSTISHAKRQKCLKPVCTAWNILWTNKIQAALVKKKNKPPQTNKNHHTQAHTPKKKPHYFDILTVSKVI